MSENTDIIPIDDNMTLVPQEGFQGALATLDSPALRQAIDSWLHATTDSTSPRFDDLMRDKAKPVADFFAFCKKTPLEVTVADVKAYRDELETRDLASATLYAMLSRISSFYKWLGQLEEFKGKITNPVAAARPRAPKPYQSQSTKSLSDNDVRKLVDVLRAHAESDGTVGKRDFAMFITYLLTGLRRTEVSRLRWENVNLNGYAPTITFRAKGGAILTREIDERIQEAILDYLETAGRLKSMREDSPLWTSHDRANVNPNQPLTSHAFAKNLKRYAKEAGLSHINIHQTRHTYARIVADQTGSIVETQDALGHANAATTRVYVQRVGVKKDKHGDDIARRLGF